MICNICAHELRIFPLKKLMGKKLAAQARKDMGGSLAECVHCEKFFILRNGKIAMEVRIHG